MKPTKRYVNNCTTSESGSCGSADRLTGFAQVYLAEKIDFQYHGQKFHAKKGLAVKVAERSSKSVRTMNYVFSVHFFAVDMHICRGAEATPCRQM